MFFRVIEMYASPLILLFFFHYTYPVVGQVFQYPVSHYSVEDGLPHAQITSTHIDEEGFLWLSTNSGIAVFDGHQFHTSSFESLKEEYIITLHKGTRDLYLNTLNGIIRYDGRGHPLTDPSSDTGSRKEVIMEDALGYPILIDWAASHKNNLYIGINDTIRSIESFYPELTDFQITHAWGKARWEENYFLTKSGYFLTHRPQQHSIDIDTLNLKALKVTPYWNPGNYESPRDIQFTAIHKDSLISVFGFDGDGLIQTVNWNLQSQNYIPIHPLAPNFFISTERNSPYFYLKDSTSYTPIPYPETGHIRNTIQYNNNIIVTSDDGLYIMHTQSLQQLRLNACAYPWTVIPQEDDTYLIGCYEEGVIKIDKDGHLLDSIGFEDKFISYPLLRSQILTNHLKIDSIILFGSVNGYVIYDPEKSHLNHIPHSNTIESFAYDENKNSVLIASKKLYWLDEQLVGFVDSFPLPAKLIGRSVPTDLLYMPNGDTWITGRGGIARLNTDGKLQIFNKEKSNFDNNAAICMEQHDNNTFWVGGTDGVFYWNDSSMIPYRPDAISGNINQLLLTDKNELIIVGARKITIAKADPQDQQILAVLNEQNGYSPSEPSENGIAIDDNRNIWIPLVNSIRKLSLDEILAQDRSPSVKICAVNRMNCMFGQTGNPLPIDGSFARIEVGIKDPQAGSWRHQYQLNNGALSPPISTNSLLISSFEHGINQLHIRSYPIEFPEKIVENELMLEASLPFWDRNSTQWVALIILILSLLAGGYALYLTRRKEQQIAGLKARLNTNRLQTIQAYLNPHFIFNTLTTIQDSILHQDKQKGNDMIVRLSRIFRYVLNYEYSEDGVQFNQITTINLKDELKLIRDYVYLQEVQYEDDIEFIENIDPQLKVNDIRLPGLLVQPFVENAYKHAFQEPMDGAKVTLSVFMKGNVLHIQIKDNGLGKREDKSSPKSNSWGKKLALERMELLNKLGVSNDIKIQHSSHGTIVNIKIDMKYEGFNR